MHKKLYVLSLGGSLIVPDKVDYNFARKFKELILGRVKKGDKFIIVCGGGGLNREYNKAAKKVRNMTNDELDWLGIYTTRCNAQFIRILFGKMAYGKVAVNPYKKIKTRKPIIIGAGYKPGWSSDYDAVYLAKVHGAMVVINLSNVDYAYDRDPKIYKNAKPIKNIKWRDFRKIVGNKWKPRLNNPFDPIASREAQKLGMKVIILNGGMLRNLENCLDGGRFRGTVIS